MTMSHTAAASRQKLFRVKKLRQLWRVVRESDAQPLVGEPRRLELAKTGEMGLRLSGTRRFCCRWAGRLCWWIRCFRRG